ncbi:MAG: sugar phosphate isomerase/epimerase [Pseudonocardiales bacterium]|nr:sugar phosphate isomerase/epimerase [Pseudonocardiales bacterium]
MPHDVVLNPDELGPDPTAGMDLAVALGIGAVEIRTAWGRNAVQLEDAQVREIRRRADERGLAIAALASPLWKWCRPEATPGRVDSFDFPTRVPLGEREQWVHRALEIAALLGTRRIRVFSHLRVEPELTEDFTADPLLVRALTLARDAGVRLLLENEPACTSSSTRALATVLTEHAPAGLRLWLDVANLHELGEDTLAAVRELAAFVDYVHVKDYLPAEGGGRWFCPAGMGVVPYRQVLPILAAQASAAPWALETHVRDTPRQALTDGARFLHQTRAGVVA